MKPGYKIPAMVSMPQKPPAIAAAENNKRGKFFVNPAYVERTAGWLKGLEEAKKYAAAAFITR